MTDERASEGAVLRDRIDRYLRSHGRNGSGARVVPLTGDASDRRYFRIMWAAGRSSVLAVHTGPIEFEALPFANVARLLREVPLPGPLILGHSDDLGIVAQQDLGDVTLQAHLGAASPTEHSALYRQAVTLIELLQRRGAELRSDAYVPYQMAFDVEKLTWELNFFVRHFIEGYRGIALSDTGVRPLVWKLPNDTLAELSPRMRLAVLGLNWVLSIGTPSELAATDV